MRSRKQFCKKKYFLASAERRSVCSLHSSDINRFRNIFLQNKRELFFGVFDEKEEENVEKIVIAILVIFFFATHKCVYSEWDKESISNRAGEKRAFEMIV